MLEHFMKENSLRFVRFGMHVGMGKRPSYARRRDPTMSMSRRWLKSVRQEFQQGFKRPVERNQLVSIRVVRNMFCWRSRSELSFDILATNKCTLG